MGDDITLADICFAAELSLFLNESKRTDALRDKGLEPILDRGLGIRFPRMCAHFGRLRELPEFAADLAPYLSKFEPTLSQSLTLA